MKLYDFILDIRTALIVVLIFFTVMIIFLSIENAFDLKFFHFGPLPSDDPEVRIFLENKITTWKQVILIYFISFLSGFILNYYITVGKEYSFVFNPVTADISNLDKIWAYTVIILNPIIFWIASIIGIFLATTKQFQFLIPGLIAALIIDVPYGIRNLRRKKFINQNKKLN